MKNKLAAVIIGIGLLLLLPAGIAFAADEDLDQAYAFEVHSRADKNMKLQFAGNQMDHQSQNIGFGINAKPMLAFRYMAAWFDFQVGYEAESNTISANNGEYSFRIKPNDKLAEIYWAGEKIREYELTEAPLLRQNVLYLYSLDISALLGLMPYWDNNARTWEILYRDYAYRELAFPAIINDNSLTLKGLLIDDGQHEMPSLQVTDIANNTYASWGQISKIDSNDDCQPRYEISSTINLQEKTNQLRVSLNQGQRIIFSKELDVAVNIEAKELIIAPLGDCYQFSNPTKGYIKTAQSEVLVSGSVAAVDNHYPEEIFLFVNKVGDNELSRQENAPIINGQFKHQLQLIDGEGLYKVSVNTIMAAPRGPAYPEITNFYVEFVKQDA